MRDFNGYINIVEYEFLFYVLCCDHNLLKYSPLKFDSEKKKVQVLNG